MMQPNETEIEVFWGSGSPFAWRVLMTAELKGIPYLSHLLKFSEKEHKAPAYLALNPRGQVPTMRDGGFVLTESLAIMTYLDAKFPDPPIFGRTPEEIGTIWRWICAFIYHFEPLSLRIVGAVFEGSVEACASDIREAATGIHAELALIEAALENQPWLSGEELSAADILAHSDIEFFLRIAGRDALKPLGLGFDTMASRYPMLSAWRERTIHIPGYDKAYPPHWRTS
jgi:glutathione S-transferase